MTKRLSFVFRNLFASLTGISAFLAWFFHETIKAWFFEKILRAINPIEGTLIEYGTPAVFAAICIWLLWRRPNDHPDVRNMSFSDHAARVYPHLSGKRSWWNKIVSIFAVKPDNFVPIHIAVARIAPLIGDTDANGSFPRTLATLRQRAANGELHVRGQKELDKPGETTFSEVHTDIPKEYWNNSTIGALATSPQYVQGIGITHTNPETAYSWGPKGVYEKNRYTNLLVEWDDVLHLWP